ncbi:hypothetical protein I551_0870 [Mycobacterium ulcerans str. Harvey]|uniref:Uncharacterized protein n=1 Tax=Mycobacterium ulcerans str. Harvey TaxID=1299332 RepID=A0ABN0R6C5_MYCUL|nr:hypothetical protein I551_0870 [Mycobacterium ulcerans str. Harvey]
MPAAAGAIEAPPAGVAAVLAEAVGSAPSSGCPSSAVAGR